MAKAYEGDFWMIKVVIFDMDGVISKTQHFHSETESELLKELGIHITSQEIINRFAGTPDRLTFKYILDENGIRASVDDLLKRKWKIMKEKIKNNIHPIKGVIKLINELAANQFLLAVASTSPQKFIEEVLQELDIKEKFQQIVSGDEVRQGKPNPEIFLLTAQKMQFAPANCLVIEDARNGVLAARNARMKSIGITTTHKKKDLLDASSVIDSFDELTVDYIKSL